MSSFEGKRVLVTGAGRGIGKELVKAFLQCKAEKVYGLSKTKSNLEQLKAEMPGANLEIVNVDLTDWNSTRNAIHQLGRIDCLVNNAGIAILEPFLQIQQDSIDKLLAVNIKSMINVSQAVAKSMIDNGNGGTIVNVSSQASKVAFEDHTVYCATKAAVDAMTRVMAMELGKYNIRVNAVNPTVVMTDMGRLAWSDPNRADKVLDRIPLHRFAEVDEITKVVLFLASEMSGMVNAVSLPIDGGYLAC